MYLTNSSPFQLESVVINVFVHTVHIFQVGVFCQVSYLQKHTQILWQIMFDAIFIAV